MTGRRTSPTIHTRLGGADTGGSVKEKRETKRQSVATLQTKCAVALCLLAAGAQMAAQNPPNRMPGKPGFENEQVVVDPPQHPPWPGTSDSGTDIPKACAALPPADRVRCGEDHLWRNHKLNRVVIRYYPGSEDLYYLDGTVEHLKWEAGTVEWSPATLRACSQGWTVLPDHSRRGPRLHICAGAELCPDRCGSVHRLIVPESLAFRTTSHRHRKSGAVCRNCKDDTAPN